MKKKLTRYEKSGIAGGRAVTNIKEERIRAAAILSREMTPTKICELLDISTTTLKRYAKDPIWQENGGVKLPRYFNKKPTGRQRDLEKEEQQIEEAMRLRGEKRSWGEVADEMGLNRRQLEHLRSKFPDAKDA